MVARVAHALWRMKFGNTMLGSQVALPPFSYYGRYDESS